MRYSNSGLLVKWMRLLAVLIVFSPFSCKDNGIDMNNAETEAWRLVPAMANIDIRYIVESKGVLYVAGVDTRVLNGDEGYGVVYASSDAEEWAIVQKLRTAVGPLVVHRDTLYLLSDSLYTVTPSWGSVCNPEPLSSDPSAIGDMVFLRDTLYAMQSLFGNSIATYRIERDGTVVEMLVRYGRSYGGSKFITGHENGQCVAYVRGQYYWTGFYRFDGQIFTPIQDGLSDLEFNNPPTNSLAKRNDTLFAGFRFPSSIKFLMNGYWYSYTDSMPHSRMYNRFRVLTEPTAIAFSQARLFVATSPLGVLEWTTIGWQRLSDGLPTPPISDIEDMYDPVVHLIAFRNKLLVGYGKPGFAPWGGVGLYKMSIGE